MLVYEDTNKGKEDLYSSYMYFMRHFISIVFLFLLLVFSSLGLSDSIKRPQNDTVLIYNTITNDTLFLKQVELTSQSNSSFELKIWIPTFTALLVLLVTNIVTLYKIRKDTKESIKKEIIISKIRIERERLEKFYDPIFTTLKSNAAIFNSYGPQTFPRDNGALETEASEVWKQLVQNVIIPNNKKVCDTIQQFSHLIDIADSIEKYLDYSVHSESFRHFINFPNALHKGFKYPNDFIESVEKIRTKVLQDLKRTESKLAG